MNKRIDSQLFLLISFGFICFTIIGTLSHELGHCVAAKYLGMTNIKLHYGSMNYRNPNTSLQRELYTKYKQEIKENKYFVERDKYEQINTDIKKQSFIVTAGGPAQTIITGTVGIIVLILYGKNFKKNDTLKFMGWIWIFLSLFWLRQSANFFMAFVKFIINGFKWTHCADEMRLANYLNLPSYSISLVTGLIGAFILIWIVFFYIPKDKMYTFILAGLVGGISGFFIWLIWLGKYILP